MVALALVRRTIPAMGATAVARGGGFKATLISVVGDGDTLQVSTGSRPITMRLACIEAPETAQAPGGSSHAPTDNSACPIGAK
jgi:endonuclease YncB( thermonuclease family)